MKNKSLLIMLILMIMLMLCTSCSDDSVVSYVNVENSEQLNSNVVGLDSLIKINGSLYYDSATHIVYWWNGAFTTYWATTPSVYVAPNGLPYKYNPDENILEEINFK